MAEGNPSLPSCKHQHVIILTAATLQLTVMHTRETLLVESQRDILPTACRTKQAQTSRRNTALDNTTYSAKCCQPLQPGADLPSQIKIKSFLKFNKRDHIIDNLLDSSRKDLKSGFPHAAMSQSPHERNVTAVSGSVKDIQILEASVHIEYFHCKTGILKVFVLFAFKTKSTSED